MAETIIEKMERKKIIAIVRNIPCDRIVTLAKALRAGGIEFMEVTFDQRKEDSFDETVQSIKNIAEQMHGLMHIGAGTVMSLKQLEMSEQAGAAFIISPNVNVDVIKATKSKGLISIPGAITPTEIVNAHAAGADYVKCFPVGPLGTAYFQAIRAPLSHIKLFAVGGIQENNLKDFLDCGAYGAGIGGNLVCKEDILENRYDRITELARRLNAIAEGRS